MMESSRKNNLKKNSTNIIAGTVVENSNMQAYQLAQGNCDCNNKRAQLWRNKVLEIRKWVKLSRRVLLWVLIYVEWRFTWWLSFIDTAVTNFLLLKMILRVSVIDLFFSLLLLPLLWPNLWSCSSGGFLNCTLCLVFCWCCCLVRELVVDRSL